jgi:Zn-dependent protease
MDFLFLLFVLVFSVVIHEVSHGYAALYQGDRTAAYMGRLTLNPLAHLDPFGSVLLPFLLYLFAALSGSAPVLFGWAKPVPYNPFGLRNLRWGPAFVALAGPASNIALAILFGGLMQIAGQTSFGSSALTAFFGIIVRINLLLGIFNLVPIPPLDGSKLLFAVLPDSLAEVKFVLERYGVMFLVLFLFFGLPLLYPIINAAFRLVTGGGLAF